MNNARQVKQGVFIPNYGTLANPGNIVKYAVAAENSGWDGLFLADHLIDYAVSEAEDHRPISDPWTTFAGVATRTEQLTLGSYITPIARRQPWQVARDLATLDQLSGGRVMLGAGLGTTPDYTRFGSEYDPPTLAEQYDEALEIIEGLWTGEPFSYDGDHYTVDEAVLRPTPVQEPRIPITIGGWWPHKGPIHRGARWDGIMPQWPTMLQHFPNVVVENLDEFYRDLIERQRSHEEEVRAMLEYYHDVTDEPGEILLRVDMPNTPEGFVDLCQELGVTWLLSTPVDDSASVEQNVERISEGPPEH